VEVVVSTVLAGIVFAALTEALFIGLKTLDATNDRVNDANDQQLIATYFTSDVESAEAVSAGSSLHPAAGVTPTVKNTLLMTFAALETDALAGAAPTMTQRWSVASAGATATARVRSLMATEPLAQAGSSGQRVARTDVTVRAVSQSIALAPSGSSSIALRNVASTSASAASVTLSKPVDTQQNDVMVTHLVVSGGSTTTVTAPSGWTLVGTRQLGTVLSSLVYWKAAGLSEPDTWTWTFNAARDVAGGTASYSRVSTTAPVNASAASTSGCGSGQTVLRAVSDQWSLVSGAMSAAPKRIAYETATVNGDTALSRVECNSEGVVISKQVLARRLDAANPVTVSCEPYALCTGLPVKVTLNVNERALDRETYGRTMSFRAVTRPVS
jgi:hypothetical protein